MWPSYHPKLSRWAAWATLHSHTKYTTYNAKTGKTTEKRKKNGKEQSSTGWMWSLSAHRVNTTQQVHHTMQLLSRASVPRKALPSFSTEHICTYLCLIPFCELEVQRRHKGICLHVARDCMITWSFSRNARVHSPGGPHTSDKYTTGVLHMVREMKYAIYNMGHAWQKGCYTWPAKTERPPNGCV